MRHLSIFIILLAVALAALAESRVDRREAEARRAERKADLIFLEAQRLKQQGEYDSYVALVTRAYLTNPRDKYLGYEYGRFLALMSENSDTAFNAYCYNLMRDYAMNGEGRDDYYTIGQTARVAAGLGYTDDARRMLGALFAANPDRPEVGSAYAQLLASTGDAEDRAHALAVYDTIEMRQGPSIPLTVYRIQLLQLTSDTAAILSQARRLTESTPMSSEFAIFAGDVYSHFGDPDSALTYLNRAVELDPASGAAYYSRANHYLSRGDSAAYDREIFLALEQPDLEVETKVELMREYVSHLYRQPAQHPRITALFDRLIATHPHEAPLHGLYGDYLAAIGEYGAAIEQLDYQLALDPSDADRWHMLIQLYSSTEDYDRATSTALKALELFPSDTDLPLLTAAVLAETEDYDRALEMLRHAAGNPDLDEVAQSRIYTSMGDVLYKQGSPDSAFVQYDKAIELDPENYLAMNNCAYFLACADRDLDRAQHLIETAMARTDESSTYTDTYAWVLFKRGEYAKAREMIDKTIELSEAEGNPLGAEVLEHAGDIYFMAREPEQARDFWKEALELDPDNALLRRKVSSGTYFYK